MKKIILCGSLFVFALNFGSFGSFAISIEETLPYVQEAEPFEDWYDDETQPNNDQREEDLIDVTPENDERPPGNSSGDGSEETPSLH